MDRQAIQERFNLYGESDGIRRVIEKVRQVAVTNIAVLLEGESGVGKELVATALHGLSQRKHRPLVVVNCGAIPEGLLESELFGAEKGAYTGATVQRAGYFEEADGGTLFLDEIGEMPAQAQVRLLRVLETGHYSRVGSSQTRTADVRVIAATNKTLAQEVAAGRFREDLYYRLSTVVIDIPSLRSRPGDIVPLFERFLYGFARQYEAPLRRLDGSARLLLERYNWPGNVRELRNVAEQVAVLVRDEVVTAESVRPLLRGVTASGGTVLAGGVGPGVGADPGLTSDLLYRALVELRVEVGQLRDLLLARAGNGSLAPVPYAGDPEESAGGFEGAGFADDGGFDPDAYDAVPLSYDDAEGTPFVFVDGADAVSDVPFEVEGRSRFDPAPPTMESLVGDVEELPSMEEAERILIAEALRRFEGNRRQTAEALGISERTLYRKIKEIEDV